MDNKIKCEYPGCKVKGVHGHILELINEKDASVNLSFCEYHFYIMVGGHFKAKIIKEAQNLLGEKRELSFELIGPLKEVEVAEQVIGAREMIAKLKSDDKSLKG